MREKREQETDVRITKTRTKQCKVDHFASGPNRRIIGLVVDVLTEMLGN